MLTFNDRRNAGNDDNSAAGANPAASAMTIIPQKTSKFNFDNIYSKQEKLNENKNSAIKKTDVKD